MQRYLTIGIVFFLSIFLFACTSQEYLYPSHDLTQETWQKSVVTNTNGWSLGADKWFFSGEPNRTEEVMAESSQSALSTMRVKVGDFNAIKINGLFQVQIFGTTEPNSVYIYGPNRGVRATAVELHGKTLSISQTTPASPDINKTIIRIGIKELNKLTQSGCGNIEARHILSEDLTLISTPGGDGNIYISGNIKLTHVSHSGNGRLNIFDTSTKNLVINNDGLGTVNVSGRVGIKHISQFNEGSIHIIGAYGNGLEILANQGKISVYGRFGIEKIDASGNASVYLYYVNGSKLDVISRDHATIGIGGKVHTLQLDMFGSSSFYGRHLRVDKTIIRAHDLAHANVTGQDEAFIAGDGMSSVYYFGNADQMASFAKDKSNIIALGPDGSFAYPAGYAQPTHLVPLYNSKKVIKTK